VNVPPACFPVEINLEQVVITFFTSYKVDDGNRLATSCSNKTNTGCS
jgi:hypothetical protein